MKPSLRASVVFLVLFFTGVDASAQVTERASLSTAAAQGNGESEAPSVGAGGRFLAFASRATNLVAGDTNGVIDVFVRDRLMGTTERVSVSSSEAQGNGAGSFGAAITPDGRYVAFLSHSTNLVAGDTNAVVDVFVRDRQLGLTERASVSTSGAQGNGDCAGVWISPGGVYVTFASRATNLVASDTNGFQDVFTRDRVNGTTGRTTNNPSGFQGNGDSSDPSISDNGRYVAFRSSASNLVANDTNGADDIFVYDRHIAGTQRVSVGPNALQANGASEGRPTISSVGRYILFDSRATNLVAGDTNGLTDVFVYDRIAGTAARVSLGAAGVQGNGASTAGFLTADGAHAAFASLATNLVPGDTNGQADVFVRDLVAGTTARASTSSSGAQGSGASGAPALALGGQFVAFTSSCANLVAGDTNGEIDAFVRDRGPAGFTSLCSPGIAGVRPCPCSNPPSGPGRGCDNSSDTGGAILWAAGVPALSADSLVLMTSGEKPTALSIVTQWVGGNAAGAVFGLGVRCTSGGLERLYSRNAVGGADPAPDRASGELSVSAQAAAKGDVIFPGQSRWYLVYYRDMAVLGGCAPTSNFNATQTGQVTWAP